MKVGIYWRGHCDWKAPDENQDLRLWVQSAVMLAIFQPQIAKNQQGTLIQGYSKPQLFW